MVGVDAEVLILLATLNGEAYLPQLLASIDEQDFDGWRLLVSDDGSEDGTVELLTAFRRAHPGKVEILLCSEPSGSARNNFIRLLRAAPDSPYYAFCDQDDVWVPGKVRALLTECLAVESGAGVETPCLAYSDLAVVAADLTVVAPSFMAEIKTDPGKVTFGSMLVENSIPGCAMLFNRAMLREFRSYSGPLDAVLMHDWWMALLAFGCGRVGFVPAKLVLYRQHGLNAAGSVRRSGLKFMLMKLRERTNGNVESPLGQARLFSTAYGGRLSGRAAHQLAIYSDLGEVGKVARVWRCSRHGILKQTMARRVFQLARV